MAMTGFFCQDNYLNKVAKLTDEEVGRLFRACMIYHSTGEAIDLDGRESIAFDFIRDDIDRAEIAYKEKCEVNRKNRLSKSTGVNEQARPLSNVNERQQTCINNNNNINKKENIKENKIIEDVKEPFIVDDDAKLIQSEQNRVLDAAEDAGFQKSNTIRAKLIALYADHGLSKMLTAIESCVTHGACTLAYLEAVLRGEPKKQKAKVNAQEYKQRDYDTVTDEIMQEQIRDMEEFMKREGKA